MKKVKENTELALRHHGVSITAKLIWVYLAVCRGQGLGAPKIADLLDIPEPDVRLALAELRKAGFVDAAVGKFRAQPFLLGTETPDLEEDEAPTPVRLVIDAMYSAYNSRRQSAGLPPLHRTAKINRQLTELAEFLNMRGWKFEDYLAFGEKSSKFMEGVKYLPFNVLVGEWLREQFVQPYKPKSRHAQQVQAPPGQANSITRIPAVELKQKLLEAGIRTAASLTKDQLRHIQDWADNMVEDPHNFPAPDEQFAPEIEWVYQVLLQQHGDE